MKHKLLVFLSCWAFCGALSAQETLVMPVVRVYDGDTIVSKLDMLPCPLCHVSIRIRGIDTPEYGSKASCSSEKYKAGEAKEYLKQLLGDNKFVTITNFKWDKYGGRIDADVFVGGVNVAEKLVKDGHARHYDGKAKLGWCYGND